MDDDIVFRGEGPCDVFLRRVRKVAFEKGKHKDGDWMAGYASTCFEGEALKWYEELDEDIQDDWKQLRKALLERFPPVSEHSPQTTLEPSSSSNHIPRNCMPTAAAAAPRVDSLTPTPSVLLPKGPKPLVPAAAPPSGASLPSSLDTLGARPGAPFRGRLAVISDSPSNQGYVGKSRIRGYYEVTANPNEALRVECRPSGSEQPIDFRLIDSLPETDYDRLGMVWHDKAPNVAAQSNHNALCIAVQGPLGNRKVSCNRAGVAHPGPVDTTVWSLSQDGSVYPVWKTPDQNYYRLQPILCCQDAKRILFVADWDAYTKKYGTVYYDKARLVLESI